MVPPQYLSISVIKYVCYCDKSGKFEKAQDKSMMETWSIIDCKFICKGSVVGIRRKKT